MAEAGNKPLSPLLVRILDAKRDEVRLAKEAAGMEEMRARAKAAPPTRPFAGGILACRSARKVIAEIKRISPGEGTFRKDFDPVSIAKSYEKAGAAAISVLTDGPFFGGSLSILAAVKEAVSLPVLRKDFVVDPYQIYEARAWGADAVLLMAIACRSKEEFHALIDAARDAGVEPLLEIHDAAEAAMLPPSRHVVGINSRDFRSPDLKVDTDTVRRVAPLVKNARLLVGESGIGNAWVMDEMKAAGVDAFLIGGALMKDADPGRALAELLK